MSKSLADLRKSPASKLPERSYEMCLSQALVAKIEELANEKKDILTATQQTKDGEKRPRRVGEKPHPRLAEIQAELAPLHAEMREHSGVLLLRGESSGAWQRWVDENPPRESGQDKNGRPILHRADEDVAYGICDASALVGRLFDFVVSWNGESVTAADWTWLMETAPPGDIKEIARTVVQMHEGNGVKANPFWSSDLSATQTSGTS